MYDEYECFRGNLKKQVLEDMQEYLNDRRGLYSEYLEESKMEDTINAMVCSLQQQEMNATYHVKYGEEGMGWTSLRL